MKGKPFTIRMDEDLRARIDMLAKKNKRTFAGQVEFLLEIGLEELAEREEIIRAHKNRIHSEKSREEAV